MSFDNAIKEEDFFEKLFGTGYNSVFLFVYGSYYTPHNSFIGFLMHYGLFGIFMLLVVCASTVKKLLSIKNNRIYLGILIVLLMYCFVLEPHSKMEFIFMLIGLYSAKLNQ